MGSRPPKGAKIKSPATRRDFVKDMGLCIVLTRTRERKFLFFFTYRLEKYIAIYRGRKPEARKYTYVVLAVR